MKIDKKAALIFSKRTIVDNLYYVAAKHDCSSVPTGRDDGDYVRYSESRDIRTTILRIKFSLRVIAARGSNDCILHDVRIFQFLSIPRKISMNPNRIAMGAHDL